MKQIKKFTVNSHDTDFNGVVRASVVQRYMQEVANLQHYEHGPTTVEIREQNKAYIVSKMLLRIYEPLHDFDEITVESWHCETKGYSIHRCGRVLKEDRVVAESSAIWALIDIQSGRLLRANEVALGFGSDEPLDIGLPSRFRIPDEVELNEVGVHRVIYPETDVNRHMNNTNYPDILCGYLPDMDAKRLTEMQLSYLHEARLGDTFKVYVGEKDGLYYVRTLLSDGRVGAEASFSFEKLN